MVIMPMNVAVKKATKPNASPISSDANQPRSANGIPNSLPFPVSSFVSAAPCCDACAISVEYFVMAEGVQSGLVQAVQVAREVAIRKAANGISYAAYGDTRLEERDLTRMVEAVPGSIAAALNRKAYYFVPLAMSENRTSDATLVAPLYTTEFSDQAICHRN